MNTTNIVLYLSYSIRIDCFSNVLIDEFLLKIDLNILKNALFLLKNCKNLTVLGLRPQTSCLRRLFTPKP